jgi:Ca2+-binding EF-hand superfamily protein
VKEFSEEDIGRIFTIIDENGTGKMSLLEFVNGVRVSEH